MISDNIVKTKFIINVLKRQADVFYTRELECFRQYLSSDSGATLFMMSKIQILKAIHNVSA